MEQLFRKEELWKGKVVNKLLRAALTGTMVLSVQRKPITCEYSGADDLAETYIYMLW